MIPDVAMCFTMLPRHFPQIDTLQRVFALIVAGREASYFVVCLLGVRYAPHYLLANPRAGWWIKKEDRREDYWETIMLSFGYFVFSPEKMIIFTIGSDKAIFVNLVLGLVDMCAVMALVVGAIRDTLPPALAVSYSITAMAGLWLIGFFTCTSCDGSGHRSVLLLITPLAIALNCAVAAALILPWYWYFVWLLPVGLLASLVCCCCPD